MDLFDIVIVGAGPSGASLARLLERENYKVLIIDRRNFKKNSKIKSCGGLIAPDAQKIIASFNLGIPKSILVGPQLFSVKVMDFDNNIEVFYQRNYINLNRQKFDSWLVSKLEKTQKLFNANLVNISRNNEIYNLKLIKNTKIININTKIIVGADGANSCVRKYLKNTNLNNYYISIQEWYKQDKSLEYFLSIFNKNITDFYSWIIPKEKYFILGSAIPYGENIKKKFKLLKCSLKKFDYNLKVKEKTESTFIFRPKNIFDIELGKNNIALVGEAAGFISPSSAEGISYAMRSSLALYNSISKDIYNFQKIYFKESKKLKLNIILKNLKSPFMYNSRLRKIVIKSKISSMDIIDKLK